MKFILKVRISRVALGSGHVCGLFALSHVDTLERVSSVNTASARTSVRPWFLLIGDHYAGPLVCHTDGDYCDIRGYKNNPWKYQYQ